MLPGQAKPSARAQKCAAMNLQCPPAQSSPATAPAAPSSHPWELLGAGLGKGNKSPLLCPVRKATLNKIPLPPDFVLLENQL